MLMNGAELAWKTLPVPPRSDSAGDSQKIPQRRNTAWGSSEPAVPLDGHPSDGLIAVSKEKGTREVPSMFTPLSSWLLGQLSFCEKST